jgi:uncharacterized membrane protein
MNDTVKRYLWSTVVTFFTGVAIVIVPELTEDFTLETVKSGAYLGTLFAAARLGLKMVLELFLAQVASKKK